jgi:DNA helicase TIP49 (TBP-interacting protein)
MSKKAIPFTTRAKILEVSDLQTISRPKAPDLRKIILTVETPDGQKFFPELRNKLVDSFEIQEIREGDIVYLEFMFQGSAKRGNYYNNIYVRKIIREL